MNEALRKLLKELGFSDENLDKIFAENAEPTILETLTPTLFTENRAKWEGVLSNDTSFTKTFMDRGFSAGKVTAYDEIKGGAIAGLGLNLDKTSEDYKDNAKYLARLKEHFEAAKVATSGDKEAIARLKAEYEADKKAALEQERTALMQNFKTEKDQLLQGVGKERALLGYGSNKKFKGGLALGDLLPAIEAKTAAYKWEYDERGNLVKVYNSDGSQIHNDKKDGFLSVQDILSKIYEPFIDNTPDDKKDGEGQRQGDGKNKPTTVGGQESDAYKAMMSHYTEPVTA